ncbi:MAG: restriction endonuclease subunit S [Filimonas sp.]|nr:restriction endonuclease subunit S [Filimonas sp.]
MSYSVKRLGDICRFEYGKNLPGNTRTLGEVDVFGSNGIVGNHNIGFTIGKTIIIGRKGSIGEVLVSQKSCWPIDTTYFVDENCTECDLDWLALVLKHLKLNTLNKASGVPGLNRDDAYDKLVLVPDSKNDQRKIAAKLKTQLSEIEKARKAAEIIRDDIKRLKHLTLEDFFSEFEKTEKFALGKKAQTTSGSTPSRGQKKYWEPADIPWIKTGEIAFASIKKSEEYVSSLALKECSLKLLPVNSVLIAMYGQGKTRGQSAVLKVPATINQACFAVLPNNTWEPEFLQLWLMYSYQELRNISENRGGNQANLNGDLLNSFEVPAPSLEVQKRVVQNMQAALVEIDKLSNAWNAKFEEIASLPNKILEEIFNEFEYE